nr:RNA-directed DNA polymerase, eukaryota [Tanacetum cinerariifolium]
MNFPKHFSFRDLWKARQEYGRVIDAYIPNRRSKLEKEKGEDKSDDDTVDNEFDGDKNEDEFQAHSDNDWDIDAVLKTNFSQSHETSKQGNKTRIEKGEIHSVDPFNIYDLLLKKPGSNNKEEENSNDTLKYPPSITPVDDSRNNNDQDVSVNMEEHVPKQKTNAQGDWIPNAKRYLIISVYAPQEFSKKRMLWSYLNHVIDSWSGETILMGDFNEVRSKEERFGTILNNHNASVFNSFISSGGLVEVPLVRCAFMWCHKSGNKMSKLDRFLISKDLMGSCPNITSITLDWYLSDHRPILLRENLDLERNVTKEEIKRAVWDCSTDKSLEPDGFTFGFYRRYWDTIKKDVVDAVFYFFTVGTFPKGGNASFIALIPKMQDAKVVKDYRPISLIGSMYKIIAKILANHLVGVLGDLVNEV